MDTKWRNRLSVFVYALLFIVGLSGPLTLISLSDNYMHRNYYHTPEFQNQLDGFAQFLNLFELNAVSPEDAKASIAVSEDEIYEYRNGLGSFTDTMANVKNEYEPRIEEALAAGNQEAVDFYTAERDQRIKEATRVFQDDEYVRTVLMKEKEQRIEIYYEERENFRGEYNDLKMQFDYYFKNSMNGKVVTNLGILQEQLANRKMIADDKFTTSYTVSSNLPFHEWISNHDLIHPPFDSYEGIVGVSDKSRIVDEADRYRQEQILLLLYAVFGLAAFIGCVYHFKKVKAMPAEQGNWALYYSKLPIDAKGLLLLATGLLAMGLPLTVSDQFQMIFEQPWIYGRKLTVIIIIASVCWAAVIMQAQLLAAERLDRESAKHQWKQGLSYRTGKHVRSYFVHLYNGMKDAFLIKSTGVLLMVLLLIVFGLGAASNLLFYGSYFKLDSATAIVYLALLVFIGIPVVIVLVKKVGYLNRVARAADELAAGSMGQELPVSGKSMLAAMAANMNVLKRGVRTLQNEQARSERLKTELITNVSHDLRTPLTSIITYTGLLKAEDVSSEERLAYIDIIDQKSKRLKVLIDDLFEVSKMASGNVELTLAQADLVQLLQQALGEYNDVIEGSSVQFRISMPETPVYARVDGQKLWRVFDNLIGNMVKYSLDHSRAYIAMRTEDQHVHVTFKNISKYEYSEDGEELLERFKRGDTSRHTDGSGLGLAIAKSIVDLHEGRLVIETDGDLFKVIVILKLEG
ncbi:sensor histidine kinase [Paenibacillus sp. MCAF20]